MIIVSPGLSADTQALLCAGLVLVYDDQLSFLWVTLIPAQSRTACLLKHILKHTPRLHASFTSKLLGAAIHVYLEPLVHRQEDNGRNSSHEVYVILIAEVHVQVLRKKAKKLKS